MGRTVTRSDILSVAADIWLESHAKYIGPRTVRDYREYLKPLLPVTEAGK